MTNCLHFVSCLNICIENEKIIFVIISEKRIKKKFHKPKAPLVDKYWFS